MDGIKAMKLAHYKWNVTKFTEDLTSKVETLKHNEFQCLDKDISDMVVEQFKLVKNKEFNSLVWAQISHATTTETDINWEELSDLAEANYQAIKTKGEWGKKTAEEEQLIA